LFPTILSLLHIPSKWKGVGNSLMTPDSIINSPYEKKRMNMQQTISDYIINELYLK
jgi:lipoteichoic acid synthase